MRARYKLLDVDVYAHVSFQPMQRIASLICGTVKKLYKMNIVLTTDRVVKTQEVLHVWPYPYV